MISFNTEDFSSIKNKHHKEVVIKEEIFNKIADSDVLAFEEFYYSTERVLYAFLLSILKNHEETLDVMQDTYLKIRGAAHLYQPMGKPMAWVFTIARNLAMSKIRTKNHIKQEELNEYENDISFSYVTKPEDRLVLKTALEILNNQEREIILLHAVSGFKHIEIAKSLDIPLSTVLSKYHRGIKKLKKYFMDQEDKSERKF